MKNHSSDSYSFIDRALHNLAFNSSALQNILSDMEDALFSKLWKGIEIQKPIFITSLPRAGTTIILESLNKLRSSATHTYRDMPLILTPVLWSKLSNGFQTKATDKERSHGDGLVISEDSPEAFEEILWTKYFPEQYKTHAINLWVKSNKTFNAAFREHIKKIIYLRRNSAVFNTRYISKNNCNIARINTIKTIFPDAKIVIPFRNPVEHATSLLQQHENFLKLHRDDVFTKKYMLDIGHFEFGELHRPIRFPEFDSITQFLDPRSLDYWLAYWISAFEELSQRPDIDFISYEKLCTSASTHLPTLCEHIDLPATAAEIQIAAQIFRAPSPARGKNYRCDESLKTRAFINYKTKKILCACLNFPSPTTY